MHGVQFGVACGDARAPKTLGAEEDECVREKSHEDGGGDVAGPVCAGVDAGPGHEQGQKQPNGTAQEQGEDEAEGGCVEGVGRGDGALVLVERVGGSGEAND